MPFSLKVLKKFTFLSGTVLAETSHHEYTLSIIQNEQTNN